MPWASAMLVSEEGKIMVLGETEEILARVEEDVKVVSLDGKYVYPGFHDSHVHLITGGLSLFSIDLQHVQSREELVRRVKEGVKQVEKGGWVMGFGWDEHDWGGEWPTADWLEHVAPDHPVLLLRYDMHAGLANFRALREANLTEKTVDPPSGRIGRELSTGKLNGLLYEYALVSVTSQIPKPSVQAREVALERAAEYLLARGVTCVHDMGRIALGPPGQSSPAWDDFRELYFPLADAGRLPLRVHAFMPLSSWKDLADFVHVAGFQHPRGFLSWGGLKEFYDGSLGSRTALMQEPYNDKLGEVGEQLIAKDRLASLFAASSSAGLSVAVHAIGDRANLDVSAVFAESMGSKSEGTGSGPQHRVEHAQHLGGEGTARTLASSGAVASIQPLHMEADVPLLVARLGSKRAGPAHSFAYRTLLREGVRLAMGSDWPVVRSDPISAIVASVFRNTSGEAWVPEESLTVSEALLASTRDAALAANRGHDLGVLEVGRWADLAVLSSDLLALASGGSRPHVLHTYISGRCVYGC